MQTGERAWWAWDIEAEEWDQIKCVTAVSSKGDVERFAGPEGIHKVDALMRKAQGNFMAHAGGIYDTLLLMDARDDPFDELLITGSAVLCAKQKNLRVRDTFRWFLCGLKKVGEYLDKVEGENGYREHEKGYWLKKEVDRQRVQDLTMTETLDYCEHDSRILLQGTLLARKYLEERGAQIGYTSGACAVNLLKAMEPSSHRAMCGLALDFEDSEATRETVRGARVECWARGRVSPVYCYDFKSAYPASYADLMLPLGARRARPGERNAVWLCRWRNERRDILAPILDAKTLAGAGTCQAWLVPEEVEDAENAGISVHRIEGWAPEAMFPVGQLFCRDLFSEKERGSFFAKVFLNSLHGKTTESVIKETWKSGKKPTDFYGPEPMEMIGGYWRYLTRSLDEHGRADPHVQPLAGAMILGRTRSKLYRACLAILNAGGYLYYSDTDSIHTSLPPEKMPIHLGSGLGELAWEGGPYDAHYLGPKAYCLSPRPDTRLADGKAPALKGALKGIPWAEMRSAVVDHHPEKGAFYRQSRTAEEQKRAKDVRLEIFEKALDRGPLGRGKDGRKGAVQVQKEGIRSFKGGVKDAAWGRATLLRSIGPTGRGKVTHGRDWYYLAPPECKLSDVPEIDDALALASYEDD